jgi:diguanylate cyclase (GGDEF)-like protein
LLYKEANLAVPKLMDKISTSHDNLVYQATHDALTKLPNRNLLYERIDYTISLSTRNQSLFAVVYLDLDDFKIINDNFGHEAGDAVLQSVSAAILDNIRKHDTVFRIGGDEFIILLTNIKQEANLPAIASHILNVIQKDIPFNSKYFNVTPSMGISIFPYNGKTTIDLINNADLAMYQAKELGGNQFQFYTEEINQKISSQAKIEMQIKDGLTNNKFFLSYLPQINLKNHKIAAAEALIRLNHPELGLVCPTTFIPIAEKSGLILQLGDWILKSAIQQNAAWQTKQLPQILVSVHIAIQHLRQRNFVRSIEKYLTEFNLDPQYLGIEIAENIFIANSQTMKVLEKLKSLGVKIILDNFGSGSMSLNYLQQIPLDYLKLDRSLVENLQQDKNNAIITKSIINIAKGLNIEVIAEGVENEFQEKFLYENFCYYAQGYYFCKPMHANELEKLLQK